MRIVAAVWGVAGICAFLLQAIWRLVPIAIDGLAHGLSPAGWTAALAWIAGMAYFEGYRGFQRGFAPRAVGRAVELLDEPRAVRLLLAPLFCMSLFHAERRRLIASWVLLLFIVAVVAGVRHLGQPYRGIIDAGVVVGLAWGVIALAVFGVRAVFIRWAPSAGR